VNHQTEFYKYHRVRKNDAAKLARLIRDQHKKAEVAKEKEADAAEKARIAALRSNDMAAYTSLLEDTKNDRLKFLLDKTDECMNQISTLLATRVAEEEEDIKRMGGEGRIKATFSEQATGGNYYETAHVKSEQVRQPSILVGGDLKEYQLGGLQWLVSLYNNRLNGILADEMGLGKTIQTISLIAYLIEIKQNLGPYLVIVPLSTLSNWVNEFAKWLPAATCICYKGTPQQRKQLFRDEVADGHFNVLLTTYEFVIRDKGSLRKLGWQYAIVDEGHRMKNNQSKFSVTLATHYNTRRRVLLTGTPLQNSLPELWALLNFLLPTIFNSAETFDQWFNKPFESFGKTGSSDNGDSSDELLSNEERMLIIHRLHELLRPFMLRRVKSEVLDQLPTKVEKVIRCELSSWQKELYKQISRKIAGEAATKNFNRGLNNVVMQLRKVCNHPYLFSQDGYHINEDVIRTSGKVELLDRMLPKLKAAGHRVLMFTQMTKMMPILEDYFAYRGFSSLRLDGSTTADEREKRMYMFNAPDSPYFIFLLSTRAGGLGLNLATADTVIIFDSDWNPMMDLQAQDRAHRIGQRKDVRVFRIITQTPVEEKILSRATEKLQMNELVVEAGKFDKSGQDVQDNSLERLKMMELLLTDFDQNQSSQGVATSEEDFDKDNDEGEEEGNTDLLNEMISSNDDDYELYCKMDMERTNAPALYTDVDDCPDWILYPNGKPEEGAELIDENQPEVLGKRRAAADVVYDDGMTEKQFCRMMDKQAAAEEKSKKKRKKRSRNAVDPSLILEEEGGGRKRAKTQQFELDTAPSRAKPGFSSTSSGGPGNGEVTAAMFDRLISVTRSIIYFKDKASKRKLSEIFLEKPCPQTYPDYYQLIDKPIGMNDILRKCRAKLYTSVNDFRDDWKTLFKNALTYNGEGSWIVVDAEVLKKELERLMEKNALSATAAASKKPVRIKLSLKKGKKKDGKAGDGSEGDDTPPSSTAKRPASQSDISKTGDSDDDSDEGTGDTSDIVGMDERQSASKRGKARGGTRLIRRHG
jgi:SNF2 family DNA or RNA helicase